MRKSLAASEVVTDNHDKNSISTSGEKYLVTLCSKVFSKCSKLLTKWVASVLSFEHLVSRVSFDQ